MADYFCVHAIIEAMYLLLQATLYVCVLYLMAGFEHNAGRHSALLFCLLALCNLIHRFIVYTMHQQSTAMHSCCKSNAYHRKHQARLVQPDAIASAKRYNDYGD